MKKYLGETSVEISKTEYAMYSKEDWLKFWIKKGYGFESLEPNKRLIDDISKILHGVRVKISIAKWSNGESELRFSLGELTKEYLEWKKEIDNY